MSNQHPIVGGDLGGTNMQIGVVAPSTLAGLDDTPVLLAQEKKKTKAEIGPEGVVDRLVRAIEECCEEADVKVKDLAAVGIGAPGAVNHRAGIVLEAVNLRWNQMPLAEILEDRLGVPAVIDNDVNVAVWGENRFGAARGAQHLLGVWVGTGVGGALVLDGTLYYGHAMTAGEIGHMHLFPHQAPGSRSLEHNTSRTAIVNRLVHLIKSNRSSVIPELVDGDLTRIKSGVVAEAYAKGDELTHEVIHFAADMLGAHIGGVVTLLSLEQIVLGGGLTAAMGRSFADLVETAIRRVAFPDACKKVGVEISSLDEKAGILGAAVLAHARVAGHLESQQ